MNPLSIAWEISTPLEAAILLAAVLAMLGAALFVVEKVLALVKVRRLKVAGVEVGGDPVEKCPTSDHEVILQRLVTASEESVRNHADLTSTIKGLEQMQQAQNTALDVLLGLAEGDKKNGQIGEARKRLVFAQGYKVGVTP